MCRPSDDTRRPRAATKTASRRQLGEPGRGLGASDGGETASPGADWGLRMRSARARARVTAHGYLARAGWAVLSFAVALTSGVLTGVRGLDGATSAPWMRSLILLGALACLAAVTWRTSRTLARIADEREALSGPLLRRKVVGTPRRWAMWIATLSTACVVSYLLNEHRPSAPTLSDLLPARALDVVVVVVAVRLMAPYICDLAAGLRTRTWPWSRAVRSGRPIREDDDVIGAISRMSPPLLLAMFLVLTMFIVTYIVGVYEPAKLLGGFGVLGLFGAGLLAAPALLRAQGAAVEPAWRLRWYDAQRAAVVSVRVFIVYTHRIIVVGQVSVLGVTLGAVTSGSYRAWVAAGKLTSVGIAAAMLGFVLARMLWTWAPHPPDQGPICTDVLASREHELTRLAGWALVFGSLCSLVAVLTS
jgi:hypothetical protein